MLQDFIDWLTFFSHFIYDALYTVKMPGFNIPVVYFFILFSLITIFIIFVKRSVMR